MVDKTYRLKIKSGETEIEIEGDKSFVLKHFNELSKMIPAKSVKKLKGKSPGRPPKKGGRGRKRGRKSKGKAAKKLVKPKIEKIDLKKLSLEELVEMARSKKENDRIIMLAYIINKVRRKREFRSKELQEIYREFDIPTPKRVDYYLRRLSMEEVGLLAHGRKKGRYKISDKGIKHISIKQ